MLLTNAPSLSVGCFDCTTLADGATVHGLADLERRRVGLAIAHAPAHVRIHRHPEVAHEHLAGARLGHGRGLDLEVAGLRHAHGAGRQDDLPVQRYGHASLLISSAPKSSARQRPTPSTWREGIRDRAADRGPAGRSGAAGRSRRRRAPRAWPPRRARRGAPRSAAVRRPRCAAAGAGRRTGSSASGTAKPRSTAARMASPARRTTLDVQPLTVRIAVASRGLSTASATSTSLPRIMKGGRSAFVASISRAWRARAGRPETAAVEVLGALELHVGVGIDRALRSRHGGDDGALFLDPALAPLGAQRLEQPLAQRDQVQHVVERVGLLRRGSADAWTSRPSGARGPGPRR